MPVTPLFTDYRQGGQASTGAQAASAGAAAAGVDWAYLSQTLGYDAAKAYTDYTQSMLRGSVQLPHGAVNFIVPSYQQWANQQLTQAQGFGAPIVEQYSQLYSAQTGTNMPPELRQQLLDALNKAPIGTQQQILQVLQLGTNPEAAQLEAVKKLQAQYGKANLDGMDPQTQQALVQQQMATDMQGALTSIPYVDQIYQGYLKAHPTPAATQAQYAAQLQGTFRSTLGRDPTADEVKQLAGKDTQSIQDYLNKTPYRNGIALGDWNNARQSLSTLWYDAFGKQPGDNEISHAAGMTPDQIKEWVDNSDSRVNGLKVGQYNGYKSALDPLMKQEFGHAAPDEIIREFSSAMSK